jgi:hypothetical protein
MAATEVYGSGTSSHRIVLFRTVLTVT